MICEDSVILVRILVMLNDGRFIVNKVLKIKLKLVIK